MKNRFDFVRIYDDEHRFLEPFYNIEFVVNNNFFKKALEVMKMSSKECYTQSKHQDGVMVICPRNYEEFKKYLSQTKVNDELHDIKVVYQEKAPLIAQNLDRNAVTLYYDNELFSAGYELLLDYAKDLLYDGKKRDEKTEKHLKRRFVCEANKIHKELVANHNANQKQ